MEDERLTLHARGLSLFTALTTGNPPAAHVALAEEAARIADRLDELDRVIAGKGVLNLMRFRVSEVFSDLESRNVNVKVEFGSVLAEARQQALALRQVLTALDGKVSAVPEPKGSALDELQKRRSARGSATAS